ncbi:hypothetical protein [Sorangium sp. So ce693]
MAAPFGLYAGRAATDGAPAPAVAGRQPAQGGAGHEAGGPGAGRKRRRGA